jgi:hypothetical protein
MAKLTNEQRKQLNDDLDSLIEKKQTAQSRLHATLNGKAGTKASDEAGLRRDIARYTGHIESIQRQLR